MNEQWVDMHADAASIQDNPPVPEPQFSAPAASAVLAGQFDAGQWASPQPEKVRMSAPGWPFYVITADRTYYPVTLKETPDGLRGEISVHPAHVDELTLREEGMAHRVLQ